MFLADRQAQSLARFWFDSRYSEERIQHLDVSMCGLLQGNLLQQVGRTGCSPEVPPAPAIRDLQSGSPGALCISNTELCVSNRLKQSSCDPGADSSNCSGSLMVSWCLVILFKKTNKPNPPPTKTTPNTPQNA